MTPADDFYEAWKQQRRTAEVPAGFAGRVMAAVGRRQERTGLLLVRAWCQAVLSSRVARFALCLLAVLVGVFQVMQVLGVFLAPSFGL
jgi:hypothetical protein